MRYTLPFGILTALPIEKIEPSESERIIGSGVKIDSLGFVTLMVAVERGSRWLMPRLVEGWSDSSAGNNTWSVDRLYSKTQRRFDFDIEYVCA